MAEAPQRKLLQGVASRQCRRAYPFRACAICGTAYALDVAHLDGDFTHNGATNLAWLCRTHHWLLDYHGLPVAAVKMLRAWWQTNRGKPTAERQRVLE